MVIMSTFFHSQFMGGNFNILVLIVTVAVVFCNVIYHIRKFLSIPSLLRDFCLHVCLFYDGWLLNIIKCSSASI